jgi:hypothetical protein
MKEDAIQFMEHRRERERREVGELGIRLNFQRHTPSDLPPPARNHPERFYHFPQ